MSCKFEDNIIINVDGYAIKFDDIEGCIIRNCTIYGGTPSFWHNPLEWFSIKFLIWQHNRTLRKKVNEDGNK